MDISINELSFEPLHNMSASEIREIMRTFISTLHSVYSGNELPIAFTPEVFYKYDFIYSWLCDAEVEIRLKSVFRSILTNRKNVIDKSDYAGAEFCIITDSVTGTVTEPSLGCLVAYEEDMPVISVKSDDIWSGDVIIGRYDRLDETGELERIPDVQVRNIADSAQSQRLLDEIMNLRGNEKYRLLQAIDTADSLWKNRETVFTHLILCNSVEEQLRSDDDKQHIRSVVKRLMELNDYFESYKGVYTHSDFGRCARDESQSVKNNKKLKNLRRFRKPDGTEDYFFFHLGFPTTRYCGRIHFLPCDTQRKCYIGYVGEHLKIAKS